MPVFFQKEINATTKLGIWKIEEDETFFLKEVPAQRQVTHPHKRLQHLAGRFILKYLFPQFPSHLIQVADTKKPFLPDDEYHFSISHCGDYAAAIVSKNLRVGIDIEIPTKKILGIEHKFISPAEKNALNPASIEAITQIWSAKEAVFKWYSKGSVDFKEHIQIKSFDPLAWSFSVFFTKTETELTIHLKQFNGICLAFLSNAD